MSGSGFLLMRRGGSLWGIANSAVAGLERQDGGAYRIAAGAEPALLVADEILGVVPELRVWQSPVTRRFWPEPFRGLSIHGRQPVVVVDPGHPPVALRPQGEDVGETEGRD
ncbi:MAG TPA: hypothetical protein VEL74_23040 [Thermoanaerobaculia bacterium]|nr:hypothetical protein [Thermoanaerobaculia bacterium]